MSYLKDREIWLSNVPTGNPPAGYFWKFIQNGKVVVRDSSGNNQIMVATSGSQAITGSLTVTGGITGTVSSASYVEYSNVANKPALVSGSEQITYSGLTGIPSGIVSGSAQIASFGIFATTGSNGFNGNQSITGSLTVTGQVVAQTLNVQQVTSSIVYSSGSNVFGNSLSNTQQFTGSVGVTGSLTVAGAGTFSNTLTLNGSNNVIRSGNELRFNRADNAIYTRLYDAGSLAANGFILDNTNGEGFHFQNNGTTIMRITSGGNVGIGTSTYSIAAGYTGLGINNATNGGALDLLLNDVKKGELYITSTSFNMYGFAGVGLNLTVDNNSSKGLSIATTGAATFSSSVTATQFVANGSGTNDLLYLDAGINTDFAAKIVSGANDILVFRRQHVSSGALDIMALGFNGNVGIGTPTPEALLHLSQASTGGEGAFIFLDNPASSTLGNKAGIRFATNAGATFSGYGSFIEAINTNAGDGAESLTFGTWNGVSRGERMRIHANGAVTVKSGSQPTGNGLHFYFNSDISKIESLEANIAWRALEIRSSQTTFDTGGNERMRINSGGAIVMGNTTNYSDTRLSTVSAGTTSATYSFIAKNSTPSDLFIVRSDGLIGFPKINDFTTGNSPNTWINPSSSYGIYINTSSIRYKRDIINYDKGLAVVNQLRPVYYKGKSEVDGDKQFAGFIAEEIDELGLTEFVNYLEDGRPNSLSYPNMVVLLTKAIQEQQSLIESLKSRIEILEQ